MSRIRFGRFTFESANDSKHHILIDNVIHNLAIVEKYEHLHDITQEVQILQGL